VSYSAVMASRGRCGGVGGGTRVTVLELARNCISDWRLALTGTYGYVRLLCGNGLGGRRIVHINIVMYSIWHSIQTESRRAIVYSSTQRGSSELEWMRCSLVI
jgi:hypothetical protein